MNWQDVGQWLKDNAGAGAALIGSMLTGNAPVAVAAGVALVSSVAGTDDPNKVLQSLQQDPSLAVELQRIAAQEKDSIRKHIETMHAQTQQTIRNGDNASDRFVRWTRPGQSWVSLGAALAYVFSSASVDEYVLGLLLTLPWTYAGLRQVGKWKGSDK